MRRDFPVKDDFINRSTSSDSNFFKKAVSPSPRSFRQSASRMSSKESSSVGGQYTEATVRRFGRFDRRTRGQLLRGR